MHIRLLPFLLLFLTGAALACGPYRLAYRLQPGLYERLPDGTERGVDVAAVRELAQRTGCRFDTQVLSQKLAWQAFERGDLDLLPSTLVTAERAPFAEFVPVLSARVVLLVRDEQARRTPDAAALLADPTAQVVVHRGAAYPPDVRRWLDQPALAGRVTEAGDLPAALRVLEAGRVAAMPIYPAVAAHPSMRALERHPRWDLWKDASLPTALALSKRTVHPADRERLRDGLQGMLRDGTLQRILEAHFGAELVSRTLKLHVPPPLPTR